MLSQFGAVIVGRVNDLRRASGSHAAIARWIHRLFRWAVFFAATYAVLWINTDPVLILSVVVTAGALYLWTFSLPVESQIAAVGLAAATVACWWIVFGRWTPFPGIWEFRVSQPLDSTRANPFSAAWWTSVLGVTLLLVTHGLVRPTQPAARGLAAWAWFGVSLWAADRGDQDGLWVLNVVLLAPIAVAISFGSNMVAIGRNRRATRTESIPG